MYCASNSGSANNDVAQIARTQYGNIHAKYMHYLLYMYDGCPRISRTNAVTLSFFGISIIIFSFFYLPAFYTKYIMRHLLTHTSSVIMEMFTKWIRVWLFSDGDVH